MFKTTTKTKRSKINSPSRGIGCATTNTVRRNRAQTCAVSPPACCQGLFNQKKIRRFDEIKRNGATENFFTSMKITLAFLK
jgi:hypothetical protein